jgi:hypothetical protein
MGIVSVKRMATIELSRMYIEKIEKLKRVNNCLNLT